MSEQDDLKGIRSAVHLRGANALKAHVPVTPAGRWAVLQELLSPQVFVGYDDNGDDVYEVGEPLISREAALELLVG